MMEIHRSIPLLKLVKVFEFSVTLFNIKILNLDAITNVNLSIFPCLGKENIVEILTQNGADASVRNNLGFAPIHISSRNGNFSIDFSYLYAKHVLCRSLGRENITETLIKSGADLSVKTNNGFTPLALAAESGSLN